MQKAFNRRVHQPGTIRNASPLKSSYGILRVSATRRTASRAVASVAPEPRGAAPSTSKITMSPTRQCPFKPRTSFDCLIVSTANYAASGADRVGVGGKPSSLEAASSQTWASCRKDTRTSLAFASLAHWKHSSARLNNEIMNTFFLDRPRRREAAGWHSFHASYARRTGHFKAGRRQYSDAPPNAAPPRQDQARQTRRARPRPQTEQTRACRCTNHRRLHGAPWSGPRSGAGLAGGPRPGYLDTGR